MQRCVVLGQITVVKAKSGFGFTIKGSKPIRIGRVKKGGAAERSGLLAGDIVTGVDGLDSARMTAESVAVVVRCGIRN